MTLDEVRATAIALDKGLFGGKLRADNIKYEWLTDTSRNAAVMDPHERVLAIRKSIANERRRPFFVLLVHELCHLATKHELVDHGVRWRRAVARLGINPLDGAIVYDGPMDKWLQAHRR
jgi:hypothetical protein